MEKHTKGPWRVSDGAILSETLNQYGNWSIAECLRDRTQEDEANLRLIAAAPELLEACKIVLNGGIDTNQTWIDIMDQIKGLIAKAEGR